MGATPLRLLRLHTGLSATCARAAAIMSISSAVSHTPCAIERRSFSRPMRSSVKTSMTVKFSDELLSSFTTVGSGLNAEVLFCELRP